MRYPLVVIGIMLALASDASFGAGEPVAPPSRDALEKNLGLWKTEAQSCEAQLQQIKQELSRPAAVPPRPQGSSSLRSGSLQPSGRLPGQSSAAPPAPKNTALAQQQKAVEDRLTQARQQIAKLETMLAQSTPGAVPGPLPLASSRTASTPAAAPSDADGATDWSAEVKRLSDDLNNPLSRTSAGEREALRQKLEAAKAKARQKTLVAEKQEDARFAQLPAMKDEFVEPPGNAATAEPSYADTIEFINSRLPEGWQMGYGRNVRRFIYRSDKFSEVFVFDAKELNPEVKYFVSPTKVTPLGNQSDCSVTLQTRNNRDAIEHWYRGIEASEKTSGIEIETADKVETEKLAKAFRHLIQMQGGKKEAF